jgi:uncharacterized protein involved in exopolysaccharide biosynthesis
MRSAEDRLQAFLQRNRDYRNSPELTFQQERLARDVSLQQTVFTTLAQSYEQAKIEEVRDTPALTLIDAPERPPQPDGSGLVKKGLLAVILGGLLGLGVALVREGFGRAHGAGSEELREFHALRRATFDQLRPWRRRSTTMTG